MRRDDAITAGCIGAFLASIAAANLLTAHFAAAGHPEVTAYAAFALLPLGFVTRDRLHDGWRGWRAAKMGALIAGGALISYAANPDARSIAIASCVAFAVAESLDALVFERLRGQHWLVRANTSNVVASVVDSCVFIALAFPGFLVNVAFQQMCAKASGGLLLSLLVVAARERRLAAG